MTKTGSKVIPQLNQFVENLDSLSLNDREAWSGFATQLAALEAEIPKQMKPLLLLLGSCRKGIDAIARKSLSDYLAIIDAIADGFAAAVHYLESGPDRKAVVQKAIETLEDLLVSETPAEEPDSRPTNTAVADDAPISLDDIAAMLVQIDGDNREEWQTIYAALEKICTYGDYPETVQLQLQDASRQLFEMLENKDALLEDFAEMMGDRIQTAMDLLVDGTRYQTESPAVENDQMPQPEEENSGQPAASETLEDQQVEMTSSTIQENAQEDPMVSEMEVSDQDTTDCMPDDPDFELIGEFVEEGNDLIAQGRRSVAQARNRSGRYRCGGNGFQSVSYHQGYFGLP
jgi:hypothetical protein